jgi:hypothetical protein
MKFSEALALAQRWMDDIEGVEGVAEGEIDGNRCITVFISDPAAAGKIPDHLGEHRVIVEQSGHFQAQS